MGAAEKLTNDVQMHKIPDLTDVGQVENLDRETANWLLDPARLHVFDFSNVITLHQNFYRVIANYKRTLAKNGKYLASINVRPELIFAITQKGLGQTFNPVETLEQARRGAGLGVVVTKPKIDFQVINPFVEGTVHTLATQANLPIETGKPHIKTGKEEPVAVAGVITMGNAQLPGSIALCFSTPVFLGIYECMVGETHSVITPEIRDAAGEILNIVYGFAKSKLKTMGLALDLAIPVILSGEKLEMSIGEMGKSIIVPFTCKYGQFHMEVYFKKT